MKDSIETAIMDCDFSSIIDFLPVGGFLPVGLSQLLELKAKLKKEESIGDRKARLAKRIQLCAEVRNFKALKIALTEYETL